MIRKLFVAAVAAQAVYCAVIEKRGKYPRIILSILFKTSF